MDINAGVRLYKALLKYFEIFNESDEYMSVQILLAPEEFGDINNNDVFKEANINLTKNKNLLLMNCYLMKSIFLFTYC